MVLTELMGKMKMNRKPKLMQIDLDDIRVNPNNHKPMNNIEELKQSIKDFGLYKPLEVFETDQGDYMLLGGERRYTAMTDLQKEDESFDCEIPCLVYHVEKGPKERLQIMLSNAQRPEDDKTRLTDTKELLEILELDPSVKPAGMLTRQWVAGFIGCSERTAQKYINMANGKTDEGNKEKSKKEEASEDESNYSYAEELLTNKYHTKCKIAKKKVTLWFDDDNDLNNLLMLMDALEESQDDNWK